jgi:diguanylate cyclase (GGDEF)-like protein
LRLAPPYMTVLLIALALVVPDTSGTGPRHLAGDWWVRAGDDPAWTVAALDEGWLPVEVPDAWESVLPGYDGTGWYRTTVELSPALARGPVGLRFGLVGDAFEVYWNGLLVGGNGRLPPAFTEGVEPHLVLVPPEALERRPDGPHLLAVRVHNAYAFGGLLGHVQVGRYDRLAQLRTRGEIVLAGLIAFFTAIGVYHLAFFMRRRWARENLHFALLCLLAAAYMATQSVAFLSQTVHLISPFRLELLVVLLAVPVYPALLRRTFGLLATRLQRASGAAALAAVPPLLLLPLPTLSHLYRPLLLLVAIGLLWITALAWRRTDERGADVGAAFLGLAVLGVAFTWDVLAEFELVPAAVIVPGIGGLFWVGFMALIMGVGFATSGTFAQAEVRALTDPLTTLSRRHVFDEALKLEVARVRRSGGNVAVVMIDLDHFKTLNDAHGHRAGDLVLERVGRMLRHNARNIDLAARLGGEEFGVLLYDTDLQGAIAFARRFRRHLQELEVEHHGVTLRTSASMGIALGRGELDPVELFEAADRFLYAAKAAGRNQMMAGWLGERPRAVEEVPDPVQVS